jgi:hypothetical protein
MMRTTLDIDADVMEATKEISARTRRSTGKVLSDLARQALTASDSSKGSAPETLNGFQVMPAEGRVVPPELVRKLIEESETS